MLKTLIAPAAAALAVLLLAGSAQPADAKRGGGPSYSSGGHVRAHSGGSYSSGRIHSYRGVKSYYAGQNYKHSHKHVRHFRRHVYVGLPLAYGYYGYYGYTGYSDSCDWLRRRAIATGRSYWWDRYYACVDGYDY